MRSTKHFAENGHLCVRTFVSGALIHTQSVEDPFASTRVCVGLTFWEWLKLAFQRPRQIEVLVHVSGDQVANKRWFLGVDACDRCAATIGYPHDGSNADDPGYHHGNERLCESCYYGMTPKESNPVGLSNEE